MVDPARGEAGDGAVGFHRAVVRGGQDAVDELVPDGRDRVGEGPLVEHPAVPGAQVPAEALESGPGLASGPDELIIGHLGKGGAPALPRSELTRHRRELQHAGPVEVLHVVQRVGDVVGQVHHRTFQRLTSGRQIREGAQRVEHPGQIDHVRGELRRTRAASAMAGAARRGRPARRVLARVVEARPRILQHRGAYRGGEVESLIARSVHLELGEDAERLRIALESVGQPETLPGQAIEHPFTEMPERRMTKIMSVGRGLHHDMIKTAKITKQVAIFGAQQANRDRSRDRRDLDRVGQPVVHDSAGGPGGDDLGDLGEPGE